MKPEYKEKLEKVIELLLFYGLNEKGFDFSSEESIRRAEMFEELIKSGDTEVLHGLMGLLTMKANGGSMLDESLVDGIAAYYIPEQIVEAISEKFDAIYDNDKSTDEQPDPLGLAYVLEGICSDLWRWSEDGEGFRRFREMFNATRPRHAERFLNEMEKYKRKEEKPMIQTLREDMAKW